MPDLVHKSDLAECGFGALFPTPCFLAMTSRSICSLPLSLPVSKEKAYFTYLDIVPRHGLSSVLLFSQCNGYDQTSMPVLTPSLPLPPLL